MDREVQLCPFDHYAALRDQGPLFFHERTRLYFASRLDIVNENLSDTTNFSSRMASAGTSGGGLAACSKRGQINGFRMVTPRSVEPSARSSVSSSAAPARDADSRISASQ